MAVCLCVSCTAGKAVSAAAPAAVAQANLAPSSAANKTFTIMYTAGICQKRCKGTGEAWQTKICPMVDPIETYRAADFAAGDPDNSFSYTKTGPNTARIIIGDCEGGSSYSLTFTTATSGTLSFSGDNGEEEWQGRNTPFTLK